MEIEDDRHGVMRSRCTKLSAAVNRIDQYISWIDIFLADLLAKTPGALGADVEESEEDDSSSVRR